MIELYISRWWNTTLFNYDRAIYKTIWWNTTLFNYDRAIYIKQ